MRSDARNVPIMERKKWKKTMTALQEKIIFDANKCRTHRFGTADLFDCLAEQQYLICGYALPFGNGQFCTHPQRKEFTEKLRKDQPINHSQPDP